MRPRHLAPVCAAVLLCGPAMAFADETAGTAETAETAETAKALGHRGQIGIHLQPGVGYRVLFPYHDEYCGQADKAVCVGRSPAFLDLGASFGVSRSVDLLCDLRLGIETDFLPPGTGGDKPRLLAVAPGVKLYVDTDGAVKFFSSVHVAFDFTKFAQVEDGTDIAVRGVNGFVYDVSRYFGVFLHFGETIGFVRWLRFELDGGLGVEGRFP